MTTSKSAVSPDEEAEWQRLGLAAFEKDWENPDDAVYDDWRAFYGIPSVVDVLAEAPGHLMFQTAEEVDAYLREEREAWDR